MGLQLCEAQAAADAAREQAGSTLAGGMEELRQLRGELEGLRRELAQRDTLLERLKVPRARHSCC